MLFKLNIQINIPEQYLLMGIKSFTIFTILLLVSLVSALHLQTQNAYDPHKYYEQLQQKQVTLKQDLASIQKMFFQIDASLETAANDPNKKLQILQEGLADERDALISIQQYLNLPLSERSCQCFNFTDEMKANIQQQLNAVSASIDQIEANTEQCSDCEFIIEIKKEVQQQRNYLRIMQDTLQAKCCKKYQLLYKDNLASNNWKYGDQSEEEYKQDINKVGAHSDQILVKNCPEEMPYAVDNYTRCINCQESDQVFDLKTRICGLCPTGKIFNYNEHKCDLVCPPGTIVNEEKDECVVPTPDYNASSCPSTRPIWNPETLGCSKCPVSEPFFDKNLKKCIQCPENYIYQDSLGECVHQQCQKDQYFDINFQICRKKEISTGSSSSCPVNKPFWDPNSLACTACPLEKPRYNKNTNKCEACPSGQTYAEIYGICVEKCGENEHLNHITGRCIQDSKQTVNPSEETNTDSTSTCPPSKPVWNSESKSCSQCPNGLQWNSHERKCSQRPINCQDNQIYDYQEEKCITKQEQATGTSALCPPDKPYYNSYDKSCSRCPSNLPYFNQKDQKCQNSPVSQNNPEKTLQNSEGTIGICYPGYVYSRTVNMCISTKTSTTDTKPTPDQAPEQEKQEPQQPNEKVGHSACPPEKPVWNINILACVACPTGTRWDKQLSVCLQCETQSCQQPTKPKQCPYNYQLNSQNNCQQCKSWEIYQSGSKSCLAVCNVGQFYNSMQRKCYGTLSKCEKGLVYDESQLRCKCPEGPNYTYSQQSQKCQKVCNQTQFYDSIKGICVNY